MSSRLMRIACAAAQGYNSAWVHAVSEDMLMSGVCTAIGDSAEGLGHVLMPESPCGCSMVRVVTRNHV